MKREAGVRVPLPEAWLRQPLVRAASPAGACARPACHLPGLVQLRVSHHSPGLPPTPHSGPAHLLCPPTCSRPSRPALLRVTRQVQGTSSSHVFRPKALRPRHLVTARSPPSRPGPSTSSAPLREKTRHLLPTWTPSPPPAPWLGSCHTGGSRGRRPETGEEQPARRCAGAERTSPAPRPVPLPCPPPPGRCPPRRRPGPLRPHTRDGRPALTLAASPTPQGERRLRPGGLTGGSTGVPPRPRPPTPLVPRGLDLTRLCHTPVGTQPVGWADRWTDETLTRP